MKFDSNFHNTSFFLEISNLISENCLELISNYAAKSDSSGKVHPAVIEALKVNNYFGLPIPVEYGGSGASFLECCSVQAKISYNDPALAIGLTMHMFSAGILLENWRLYKDLSWVLMEAVASQNRIISSAFAEPSLAGSLLRSNCMATKTNGGYIVNGIKTPVSILKMSELICMQIDCRTENDGLMVALIPNNIEGITIKSTWDTMGMRSSESDTLIMNNCFISDDLIFHRTIRGSDSGNIFSAGLCWFIGCSVSVYIGGIRKLIDEMLSIVSNSKVSHLDKNRSELPTFQSEIGLIISKYYALETSCIFLASAMDSRSINLEKLLPLALSLKETAIETVQIISSKCMQLCGGKSYSNTNSMSRYWRDLQAIIFHPPTSYATKQILGKWSSDLPFSFELNENSDQIEENTEREHQ
ncbi:acyl-CoA dehydrogenase (plasmid) [Leptospira interrogans serovar Canicola]|uniref:Acyl-CoA dehydrogenase n=3 Tax=Leptospira interrogans TaxID=173 RepID=A0AAQ0B146_LEPIR|nr:acyl-CoA dehydrogenase [Leptospira interrogans serovar Canicola]QOI53113.1 acyl-CoA dehydrogenase [Leptospira interrogans serovar Bataviae]